jgi:hypothetical protein
MLYKEGDGDEALRSEFFLAASAFLAGLDLSAGPAGPGEPAPEPQAIWREYWFISTPFRLPFVLGASGRALRAYIDDFVHYLHESRPNTLCSS